MPIVRRRTVALALCAALATGAAALARERRKLPPVADDSGFAWLAGDDSIPHEVDRKRVAKGVPRKGHPRDVIPPIDEPAWYRSFADAEKELGLRDVDRVLGVVFGDDARAYPKRILDRHEVVNDTVGGRAVAVLW